MSAPAPQPAPPDPHAAWTDASTAQPATQKLHEHSGGIEKLPSGPRTGESRAAGAAAATRWSLRHFQWYQAALTIVVMVATSLASSYIKALARHVDDLLDVIEVDDSLVGSIMSGIDVILAASGILALSTLLVTLFASTNKLFAISRRERFAQLAQTGNAAAAAEPAWRCCYSFSASRCLSGTVHAFTVLTAIWFIALLCALIAAMALLVFVEVAAEEALDVFQDLEEEAHGTSQIIIDFSGSYRQELTSVQEALRLHCNTTDCPPDLFTALDVLTGLEEEVAEMQRSVADAEELTCSNPSCVKLDLLWFLEADGCVCASENIKSINHHAQEAIEDTFWAAVNTAIALLGMLLLISKTAMNLKSLLKDQKWIARVRAILSALTPHSLPLSTRDSLLAPTGSAATAFCDLLPPSNGDSALTGETARADQTRPTGK